MYIKQLLNNEATEFDTLAAFNIYGIRQIMGWLGVECPTYRSSDLQVNGTGSSYNLAIVNYLGGTAYLSGKGGSNYQNEDEFTENSIKLKYSAFSDKCSELYPTVIVGYSILDSLFHFGIEGTKNILQADRKSVV